MATTHFKTVSNNPRVIESKVDTLSAILDEYVLGIGAFDDTKATVNGDSSSAPRLSILGAAPLRPIVNKTNCEGYDPDNPDEFVAPGTHEIAGEDDTTEFFQRVAGCLEDQLAVKVITHEKLRSVGMHSYAVTTRGVIVETTVFRDGLPQINVTHPNREEQELSLTLPTNGGVTMKECDNCSFLDVRKTGADCPICDTGTMG